VTVLNNFPGFYCIDENGASDFYRISLIPTTPNVTFIANYGGGVYPASEGIMSSTINPGGRWGGISFVDTVSSPGDTLLYVVLSTFSGVIIL
jgi:hypothetical protein